MPLVDRLERKLGRFAIPGLLRVVAFFQLFVWVLIFFNDQMPSLLMIDRDLILKGEVWRLFSFVLIPRATNPLFIIIAVLFLFFISDGLEQAWGAFRVNLYFFGSMFCVVIGTMAFGVTPTPMVIFMSLILAFSCIYPNVEIMLFLIIPVKMKYVGMIDAGFIILTMLSFPAGVLLAITPFLIVFVPRFFASAREQSKATARRARFQDKIGDEDGAFHTCMVCGVTDKDEPDLEFRVADDGLEYCPHCLPDSSERPGLTGE